MPRRSIESRVNKKIQDTAKALSKMKKGMEGVCPDCGGKDLDYYEHGHIEDKCVVYPWCCRDCKTMGEEVHNLVFAKNIWLRRENKDEV